MCCIIIHHINNMASHLVLVQYQWNWVLLRASAVMRKSDALLGNVATVDSLGIWPRTVTQRVGLGCIC